MSEPLTFIVPGQPEGKGRPRVRRVRGHAQMFTPVKTVAYEGLVALAAQQAMAGRPLFDGALDVTLEIRCQVPASWSGKKQREALAGLIYPVTKPDADNTIKAIFDALNGVVWKDDVAAVDGRWTKRYAEVPGVAVTIQQLSPPPAAAGLPGSPGSSSDGRHTKRP